MFPKSDGLNRKRVVIPTDKYPQFFAFMDNGVCVMACTDVLGSGMCYRDDNLTGYIVREVLGKAQFYEEIDETHELWSDYLLHKKLGLLDNSVFCEEGTPAFNRTELKAEIAYNATLFKKKRDRTKAYKKEEIRKNTERRKINKMQGYKDKMQGYEYSYIKVSGFVGTDNDTRDNLILRGYSRGYTTKNQVKTYWLYYFDFSCGFLLASAVNSTRFQIEQIKAVADYNKSYLNLSAQYLYANEQLYCMGTDKALHYEFRSVLWTLNRLMLNGEKLLYLLAFYEDCLEKIGPVNEDYWPYNAL